MASGALTLSLLIRWNLENGFMSLDIVHAQHNHMHVQLHSLHSPQNVEFQNAINFGVSCPSGDMMHHEDEVSGD